MRDSITVMHQTVNLSDIGSIPIPAVSNAYYKKVFSIIHIKETITNNQMTYNYKVGEQGYLLPYPIDTPLPKETTMVEAEVPTLIRSNGFKIPKETSDLVKNYLYLVSRNGAVIYRRKDNEKDITEELVSVAIFLGLTIFTNDGGGSINKNNGGIMFVNEKGAGGNKSWGT